MIKIKRERWVIIRDDTDILCGLKNFDFRPIESVVDTAIKTYLSKGKAIESFNRSYFEDYDGVKYKAVKVTESIEEK